MKQDHLMTQQIGMHCIQLQNPPLCSRNDFTCTFITTTGFTTKGILARDYCFTLREQTLQWKQESCDCFVTLYRCRIHRYVTEPILPVLS